MGTDSLQEILETRLARPEQLVEVLQDVQERCGWISEDAMRAISEKLTVPLIDVYRTASFYRAFSLQPRGRHLLTICTGTACHVRGAPRMLDEVLGQLGVAPGQTTDDGAFTVECVNCLGACAMGPVVVLDGKYHAGMSPGKLRKLIQSVHDAEKGAADGGDHGDIH